MYLCKSPDSEKLLIFLINLVLLIISTCFPLLLGTASQGDRIDSQYYLHFIDVSTEALLGTETLNDKMRTRIQFSLPTCCLIFKPTNLISCIYIFQ